MNAETSFLYGFITGDQRRLDRFLDRWRAGGVVAVKRLTIQVLEDSLQGDEPVVKVQRRLIHESLQRVSWLALGLAATTYERNAA